MSYSNFLALFVVLPLFLLALHTVRERRRGKTLPPSLQGRSPFLLLALLVAIALLYTTPWDNYLVATRVWWYNSQKVMGIVLGWVPLEEYLFFILQPLLVGLWMLWLARRLPEGEETRAGEGAKLRTTSLALLGALWVAGVVVLLASWQPGRYLALEVVWGLPPILLQLYFGADILLRHRRLIMLTVIPMTLYLACADSIAIAAGIWTIDPAQSLNWFLGGVLPLEELVFFLLTTVLVSFGLLLGIAEASWRRLALTQHDARS